MYTPVTGRLAASRRGVGSVSDQSARAKRKMPLGSKSIPQDKVRILLQYYVPNLILHLKMHLLQIIPHATKKLHLKIAMEMGYLCA